MSQEKWNSPESLEEKLKKEYQKKINQWEKKYFKITEANKLDAAEELADLLHDWTGVLRRVSGVRYAEEHLKNVAGLVDNFAKPEAYLHDLLEDTYESFKKFTDGQDLRKFIEEHFGKNSLKIIEALTKDSEWEKRMKEEGVEKNEIKILSLNKSLEKIKSLKNEEDGEGLFKIAGQIRVADILQNLSDYEQQSDEKWRKRNLDKAKKIFKFFKDEDWNINYELKKRINDIKNEK